MSDSMSDTPKIIFTALFVAALVTTQILAVKILALPLPSNYPLIGSAIIVPAGVLAYSITYFVSDCYTELFGRRDAQIMVNVGFAMNFVLLALLWLAILAPAAETGVDAATFASVLAPGTNIILGSLIAILISQNWDVIAFYLIGKETQGRYLWLRNIGSTATSQFLDTVFFIVLAFSLIPAITGIDEVLPLPIILQLIAGQYLLKFLIALLDTPFVYLVIRYSRNHGIGTPRLAHS